MTLHKEGPIIVTSRGPRFYQQVFGKMPRGRRVINIAAGCSYWPRADINIDPIYAPSSINWRQPDDAGWALYAQDLNHVDINFLISIWLKRRQSYRNWRKHKSANPHKYMEGSLPNSLPIKFTSNDIVVISYFLFTYKFSAVQIMQSLATMRPAEIRIFPYSKRCLDLITHDLDMTVTYEKHAKIRFNS